MFGDIHGVYGSVTWRQVAEANPDVIIIHDYQDSMTAEKKITCLKKVPELRDVPAIRQERFVILSLLEVFPGIQTAKAVDKMIRAFHPNAL